MMSQVDGLKFCFVLPGEGASEDEASDNMKEAFEITVKYNGDASWIKPSLCSSQHKKNVVFVFDEFSGGEFEKLKQNSAKIVGPRVMVTCINSGRSLPPGVTPVFTEGMRGLVVCCTGFDVRSSRSLQEKVHYMGGNFDSSLRTITTHVVACNTLSAKAMEGFRSAKPIMRREWVDVVWERSLVSNVNGADVEFDKYKAPLFHNLKMTTSGVAKKEKDRIKEALRCNGGTFTGELEEKSTNILLIASPTGEKYKFALSWDIQCVKPAWLYQCLEKKAVVPLADYLLTQKTPKVSTPKKDAVPFDMTVNFSMISNGESQRGITHVDETVATLAGTPGVAHKENQPTHLLERLSRELSGAGAFLDGCNIFLSGFSPEHAEKVKKACNAGGATRFDELTTSVTHIVVGATSNMDAARFRSMGAAVLSAEWLLESARLRRPAPEERFLLLDPVSHPSEPPSPLSKQGAKLLFRNVPKPSFEVPDPPPEEAPQDDLLMAYNMSQPGEPLQQSRATPSSSRATPIKQESTVNSVTEDFFTGLKFFVSRDLSEEEVTQLEELIVERGGQTVSKKYSGVPDYAVVPISGATLPDMTTKEIVNALFIKDCCLESSLVAVQYFHRPVSCVRDAMPLTNCVISVSNYVQCERDFIECLIEILGATSQSLLARKAKDNALKSTHLVCAEPTGQKYSGALRWGLPVVHQDWLLKCATLGARVSEVPYLVGDSKLSTSSSSVNKTAASGSKTSSSSESSRVVETPRAPLEAPSSILTTHIAPGNKTSVNDTGGRSTHTSPVNRTVANPAITRLKQLETPKNVESPDANRTITPNSPYGGFYNNENPSPGTRKRLLHWMQQGAEFPVHSPFKPQEAPRRNSTPISCVLSNHLMQMKRKPEELPSDSPVRLDDYLPPSKRDKQQEDCIIAAGLQKMKEIEESCVKVPTPPRKTYGPAPSSMMVVAESQPYTEVGWEYPSEEEATSSTKTYMLSGFSDTLQDSRALLEACGGLIAGPESFDTRATHLVANSMTRGEKLIGSIAAGLWVLQPSYLEELRRVGSVQTVGETQHEWGLPDRVTSLPEHERELAHASHLWRRDVSAGKPRVFSGMRVLLLMSGGKKDSFSRIVEAGDGTVVDKQEDATLCVGDANSKQGLDLAAMAKRRVPCVTVIFLSDHILRKKDAFERNFVKGYAEIWKKYQCGPG